MEKTKNKQILKEYIKKQIRNLLEERKKQQEKENIKSLAKIGLITKRFPKIKKTLEDLMSPSFAYYVKNIEIIAPKPTTFRVTLKNELDFDLTYNKTSFIAKVSGKKYRLIDLGDTERASQAITDLLSLSPQPKEVKEATSSESPEFNQGLANDLNSISTPSGGGESSELPELQPEQVPTTPIGGEVGGNTPVSTATAAASPAGGEVGSPNFSI